MSFDGRPSNANELILWNGIEFYSGKITGNNISNVATVTRISMNTVLTAVPQLVLVDVSLSPVTVTMPASPTDGMTVIVKNDVGDASVRNITVLANAGQTIEHPASIGSFGSSAIINIKSGAIAWSYDTTQSQWAISALAYSPVGIAGGDLGGNYPNPQVAAISGSSPILITPAILEWTTGTTAPTLTQAANTTNSATAQELLIQAQSATGTTSTGGNLVLASGTGTSVDGYVQINIGQSSALVIHNGLGVQINSLGTGVLHSDSSGNLTSSLIVNADVSGSAAIAYSKLNLSNSIVNADVNSAAAIAYSKLNLSNSIVNADINSAAAIAYSKLNLTGSIVNADIASGAAIAVSKLAAGSTTQVLLTNGSTPTWTSLSSDVTVNATGTTTVNSISGSSPINIAAASVLEWSNTVSSPTLTQANTSSGNGAQMLVQAQTSSAATSTGGNLILASGAGTSIDGYLSLEVGLSPAIQISGTRAVQFNSYSTGVLHSDSSGNLTSSLIVNADVSSSAAIAYSKLNLTNSIVNADINSAAAIAVSKLAAGSTTQVLLTNGSTPTWTTLSSDVTVSASGVTTVNSISGSSPIAITPANLQWTTATSSPKLSQADNTTNSATGQTLTVQAQNATGTTANGGDLALTSGTGTSAAGKTLLQAGGTSIAKVDSNKFYALKGLSQNVTIKTHADNQYTVLATDNIIAADVSGGVLTVNLPTSPAVGDTYAVKDYKGAAATSNITVDSGSGNKIDGAQTFTMDVNYESITVVCVAISPVQWMLL